MTELPQEAATQICSPSKTNAEGAVPLPPMRTVISTCPSELSLVTELSPLLATHIFSPSKASARGKLPTAKVAIVPPSPDHLDTVLSPNWATQICSPSNARARGPLPDGEVCKVAPPMVSWEAGPGEAGPGAGSRVGAGTGEVLAGGVGVALGASPAQLSKMGITPAIDSNRLTGYLVTSIIGIAERRQGDSPLW